jgi:hypothetical protein
MFKIIKVYIYYILKIINNKYILVKLLNNIKKTIFLTNGLN